MKLAYGLTEEQMKEVHSIVEKEYCKSDIQAVIDNGGFITVDYDITNLQLTDEEMAEAIEFIKSKITYTDYAREAIEEVLDRRNKK